MTTPFSLPLSQQAELTAILNQPHRHYHGVIHVNDCLSELYKWWEKFADDKWNFSSFDYYLTYAIWFHDIVYNPYAPHGVNEYQSAKLFLANYRSGALDTYGSWGEKQEYSNSDDAIYQAITATANHIKTLEFPNEKRFPKTTNIIKHMMDIDLAQMGHPPSVFCKNSLNIRREYHRTSDMDVVKGRLKFFKQLDQRETFYYTEYFRDLYHTQSKKNVKKEIDVLEECVERNEAIYYFDYLYEFVVDMP